MLNEFRILGRLGRDPELQDGNGKKYCRLNIATNKRYKDRDGKWQTKTDWNTVTVFDATAENCASYLAKGSTVLVKGYLYTRKRQDNGKNVYSQELFVEDVQFVDRKNDDSEQGQDEVPF